MIIRQVEIVNFLSHRYTSLAFDTGIVVIVGPNGAGKSSIIDAITFTLFDFHSRGKGQRGLVRLGAPFAQIRVVFEVGGQRYVAERRLDASGRTTYAALYNISGGTRKLLARDPRSVVAEVEKIVGVKREVARVAFISPQGELATLLEQGSKRKEYVNKLLGIDAFEKAYQYVRTLYERWRVKLSIVKTRLEDAKKELKRVEEELKRLEGVEEELQRVREELEAQERGLEELRREEERLNRLLGELEGKARRVEKLEQQVQEIEERLRELEAKRRDVEEKIEELSDYALLSDRIGVLEEAAFLAEKLRHIAKLKKQYEKEIEDEAEIRREYEELSRTREQLEAYRLKEKELNELQGRVNALQRTYSSTLSKLEDIKKRMRQVERLLVEEVRSTIGLNLEGLGDETEIRRRLSSLEEKLANDIESVEAEIQKLRDEKARIEAQYEELGKRLSMLARASSRCPVCGKPLSEHERLTLIRRYKSEREQLKTRLEEINKLLYRLEIAREDLKRRLERLRERYRRIERYITQLEEYREQYRKLMAEKEEIENLLRELRLKLLEANEVREKLRELENVEARLKELQSLLSRIEASKRMLNELLTEAESIYARLEEIAENLEVGVEELVGLTREDIAELRARIEEYLEFVKEREKITEEIKRLKEEYDAILEELEELRKDIEMLDKVKKEYEKVKSEVKKVESIIKRLQEKKGMLENMVQHYKELLSKREELSKTIEELEREHTRLKLMVLDLDKLRRLFSPQGLPQIIRSLARDLIERYMRDILARFNIDFIDVSVTEDYDVKLVTRNGIKDYNMLSGGEKTALALAFRIALARALAGRGRINSMILDEPTLYLDEQRKKELVNILRYGWQGGGLLPQLIIVTHDREIEEAADQIIEVKREANSESRVEVLTPTALS